MMIAHLSAVHQDKAMPTTAVLYINCQSVARLSRASSPATRHYLQQRPTNHVTVLSDLPSVCQVYRAVQLAIHLVEFHPKHSRLQSILSLRIVRRCSTAMRQIGLSEYDGDEDGTLAARTKSWRLGGSEKT